MTGILAAIIVALIIGGILSWLVAAVGSSFIR